MTTLLILIIYLSFISLGLPDSLLGSAWPSMYQQMGASITGAGIGPYIMGVVPERRTRLGDRLSYYRGYSDRIDGMHHPLASSVDPAEPK